MEGRFLKWCLLILVWIVVFVGYALLLDRLAFSGWQKFIALIPVLLLIRLTVQKFLSKQ